MQIRTTGIWCACALLAGASAVACVDRQEAPPLTGPSTTAQALELTASPDRIVHDGAAQSVVTVAMHDATGQPLAGQRIGLGTSIGTISHLDVVTAADGRASFIVRAPALSTPADKIVISATPFTNNFDNAFTRTMSIGLTGTLNATAPTAAFTFTPETPASGDTIVFDASTTTDEGQECGDICTYRWSFGGLGAGLTEGRVVARNAVTAGTYAVTLTVTDNAGTVSSTTRAVTVAAAAAPAGP